MDTFETIDYNVDQQVAYIILNRPDVRNALNQALRLELRRAIEAAEADDDVRVVVLAAAGDVFCSGADLAERLPGAEREGFVTELLDTEYLPVINGIREADKPFVVAVNGTAAGIGAALALACDLVVMADNASLYCAFGAISLVPDGGFHGLLLERLGRRRAFEVIALSQRLSAGECQATGLANRVVPAAELLDATDALAAQLAAAAPLTLRNSKRILRHVESDGLDASIALEGEIQDGLVRSRDFAEGTGAFFERRTPKFEGR